MNGLRDARVLVTGGRGQLGCELARILAHEKIDHWCLDLPELDITREESILLWITRIKPTLLLHCAAFTKVDACESEQEKAIAVNAEATATLAAACREMGIPMLYVSTDFVFDGGKGRPYEPGDQPNPLNVYGRSKLQGELAVKQISRQYWIVRTSWVYGVHGENFPKAILRLAAEKKTPRVVMDQRGSPTYAKDLAAALCALTGLLSSPAGPRPFGTFHFSNKGVCSWWEFAAEILHQAGWLAVDPGLAPIPISSAELDRPAKRPPYSALDLAEIERHGILTRHWQESLQEFLAEMRISNPELFTSRAASATEVNLKKNQEKR